jgi:BirA family biotin operon repressor/biotin-[acetyl-CoA-carboxylase] ligase
VTLATVERLIAALIAAPNGLPESVAVDLCGAEWDAVRDELARRGYRLQVEGALRLQTAGRRFDPAQFERHRSSTLGTPLQVWEHTASTNDLARDAAAAGAPHGATFVAEFQTQGRGRQGRTWTCAPHAGILASCVLRLSLQPPAQPLWLPLALGLGVCEALRQAGVPARTKWPNDIVLATGKLGGILIEARASPGAGTIFGLGINVHRDVVAADADFAAAALGAGSREEWLARILAGIESRLEDWCSGRIATLHAAWLELDCLLERQVVAVTAAGTWQARAVGVDPHGMLELELEDGSRRTLAAGEVHLA